MEFILTDLDIGSRPGAIMLADRMSRLPLFD